MAHAPTPDTLGDSVFVTNVALGEYDVRGALLVGDTRAVVWDTLSHPRDMAGWLPLIGGRDLVVVYSHADWDHIWGTAGLPLRRATIVGQRECQARFTDDVPRTHRDRQLAEPGAWEQVLLVAPDAVFDAETTVDLVVHRDRVRRPVQLAERDALVRERAKSGVVVIATNDPTEAGPAAERIKLG